MKVEGIWKLMIQYGALIATVIVIIQLADHQHSKENISLQVYQGITAIAFASIGIFLGLQWTQKSSSGSTLETTTDRDEAVKKLGLSERELEVLELLAQGLSNQEIADQLHLSMNTIKTHCARLYSKLDVSRRTQAIQAGQQLGLLSVHPKA